MVTPNSCGRIRLVSPEKTRVPAVDGWFTMDPEHPRLLGTRCSACGSYFFPREMLRCRNPHCGSDTLEQVPLSSGGTIWSYTVNHYPPPPPAVTPEPFTPYGVAAVELADERLVVLGQVPRGREGDLALGSSVELVLDTLYEDDEHAYVVWKWQPVAET
jgi:uncharacterized OB-fold protein